MCNQPVLFSFTSSFSSSLFSFFSSTFSSSSPLTSPPLSQLLPPPPPPFPLLPLAPPPRPNLCLFGKKLDPYTMGALLSLYEHKVGFQGFLWDINSYDQEGVQLGKVMSHDVMS